MIIAAMHQPHYMPWLGYFEKIQKADLFVIVDHVQFERKGWQNRNYIKSQHGKLMLSIPVVHRSREETILEKEVCFRNNWRYKHFKSIEWNYGKAPYWEQYKKHFENYYAQVWPKLIDWQIQNILDFLSFFKIDTPVVRSSELGTIFGKKTEMIIELCQLTKASAFISGDGSYYLDSGLFKTNDIQLIWQNFKHPEYAQQFEKLGFLSHLSALDLLLNEGPEGWKKLFNSNGSRTRIRT